MEWIKPSAEAATISSTQWKGRFVPRADPVTVRFQGSKGALLSVLLQSDQSVLTEWKSCMGFY